MAFFTTFTERADIIARMSVAYALMAVLFMLNVIAVSYPLTGAIKAPLFLIGIYYWAIYRPSLLPLWSVFIVGCIMDLLGGLPVGISALVFVVAQWLVSRQRRFFTGQSFLMIWIGFALISLVAGLIQWTIFSLTKMHWFSVEMFLIPAILGIALFPVICVILHLTHKILPTPHSVMRARN